MTDLERIKKLMTNDGKYSDDLSKEIVEAATRMSERIAELEKYNKVLIEAFNEKNYKWLGEVTRCQKAEHEIDRLKAELAAVKPITCGECKLWHKFNCNFAYDDENLKENDFCSKGIRKEE